MKCSLNVKPIAVAHELGTGPKHGSLVEGVAEDDRIASLLRHPGTLRVRLHEDHVDRGRLELLGEGQGESPGAQNDNPVSAREPDPEQRGQGARRHAGHDDRRGDYQEDQRDESIPAGNPLGVECRGGDRGHGGRDNSSGRDGADEDTLAPTQSQTPGRHPHAELAGRR